MIKMSLELKTTSGVWGAVGVAAKGVIGGYLHSSGISTFSDVSDIRDIIYIFLPLEAESSLAERTWGYGKATGVVALLTVGVVIASSTTSIDAIPLATPLSLDNTNN